MELIDLTHLFTSHMPVYPGDSVPQIIPVAYLDQQGYNDHQITTSMHVGTHMDGPLHMIKDGKRLSDISPEKFFGRGVLIDVRGQNRITADLLNGVSFQRGDAVLVLTDCSRQYGTSEYFASFPPVTEDFAQRLIDAQVHMLGLDSASPDAPPFVVHKLLLQQEILIIENLTNLEKLIDIQEFEVIALPAKFETDGAPVRVVARTK